ncbi:MAG: hypothetical protein PVJ57_16480 [Phycisphaerae bacterium]
MAKQEEELKACELCGATIYPEHIKKGTAEVWMGKLLCKHCLAERKLIATVNPAAALADTNDAQEPEEPLALVEEEADAPAKPATHIQAFGGGPSGGTSYGTAVRPEAKFRRPLLADSPHATRCRTFHCKLNDASITHMNEVINEWVDSHPDIEIRFASNCVGTVEGKSSSEPNLFVTVFY